MLKIRYHHLLCLPRFTGKGYSSDFCSNMQKIKEKIKTCDYELVDTCDDICACCPKNIDGKCKSEDKVYAYDQKVRLMLESKKLPQPAEVCSDCEWYSICRDKNAESF